MHVFFTTGLLGPTINILILYTSLAALEALATSNAARPAKSKMANWGPKMSNSALKGVYP